MRRVAGLLLTLGGLTIVGGFLAVAALFMSAGMESEDNDHPSSRCEHVHDRR